MAKNGHASSNAEKPRKDFHEAARSVVEQLVEVHQQSLRDLQEEIRKLQTRLQEESSENFRVRSPWGRLPEVTPPRKPRGAFHDLAVESPSRDWTWSGFESPLVTPREDVVDVSHVQLTHGAKSRNSSSASPISTKSVVRFKDQASVENILSINGHARDGMSRTVRKSEASSLTRKSNASSLTRKSNASSLVSGYDSEHRYLISDTSSYKSSQSALSVFTMFGNGERHPLDRLGNKSLDTVSAYDSWKRFVVHLLEMCAQTDLRRLRNVWIQSETFLNKILRNHSEIDIVGAVPSAQQIAEKHSLLRRKAGQFRRSFRNPRFLSVTAYGTLLTIDRLQKCRFIIDPHSPLRLIWALMGMTLMVYDLIMLPMEAFELPDYKIFRAMTLGSQIFWTVDILITFITGVYIDSKLEKRIQRISVNYAKTWLAFDVTVVAALWVVYIVVDPDKSNEVKGSLTSIKYVRILRFLRLVRVAKFDSLLVEVVAVFNSHDFLLLVGIVKLMVIMVLVNHILACIFFAVGRAENGGWANRDSIDGSTLWYRYLSAMHWALTQFQGTSDILPGDYLGERAYAVGTVIFALLALSSFVSSLTNMMMQLQNLHQERTSQERAVLGFLNNHDVSSSLSIRIKKYVQWRQRLKQKSEYDTQIYNILPPELLLDLQDEVRSPHLAKLEFFSSFQKIFPRIVRKICHDCVEPVSPAPSEYIFKKGDLCHFVYFISGGHFIYTVCILRRQVSGTQLIGDFQSMHSASTVHTTKTASPVKRAKSKWKFALHWRSHKPVMENTLVHEIGAGSCLSEAVLWTEWHHQGELQVISDSSLLQLNAEGFIKVVTTYPPAHASCVIYARNFLAGLNRFGQFHTDLIDQSRLWGIDRQLAKMDQLRSDEADFAPKADDSPNHDFHNFTE